MKTLLLAGTTVALLAAANLVPAMAQATKPVSQVVQWNRTLLVIVRTPGAQPTTIHPTRSFAIMHGAIYDAVNAIDATHKPYLVRLSASHFASQEAAAAAAAHEVLIKLYPSFQATLDAQLQQSLTQIPNTGKADGVSIGNSVANRILALRNNDGSNAQPVPYVFGNAPGNYQSTPPNFPKQPQFTHWSRVTPFALESANQFRPGGPPALTSDRYSDAFDQVKSLGIANSATATADEALTGRFWNGAIQNYWNEIAQTASVAHNLTTAENARLFALLNLSFADGVIAFYDAKYTYNFWRPVTAIRAAGVIASQAVLIAIGIDWDGRRQVLAVELANRESRSSWRDFLLGLKARGLHGVEFVVADDHAGLRAALREVLAEAAYQRCYVHFLRNALDHVPRRVDDDCLQELRWLYDRRDLIEARRDLAAWLTKWSGKYSKLTGWVEDNIDETLTFYRLPRQHHKHLKSTNMLERLNEEIRRRTQVVRIFPNGESCLRLVRALAVETHENWLEQHRYLNMDDLREHKKEPLRRAA